MFQVEAYHGTRFEFKRFNQRRCSYGCAVGAGLYCSDDYHAAESHTSEHHADTQARYEAAVDKHYNENMGATLEEIKKRYLGHAPAVLKVELTFKNPFIIECNTEEKAPYYDLPYNSTRWGKLQDMLKENEGYNEKFWEEISTGLLDGITGQKLWRLILRNLYGEFAWSRFFHILRYDSVIMRNAHCEWYMLYQAHQNHYIAYYNRQIKIIERITVD